MQARAGLLVLHETIEHRCQRARVDCRGARSSSGISSSVGSSSTGEGAGACSISIIARRRMRQERVGRSGWNTGSGSGSHANVIVRLWLGRNVAEELTDDTDAEIDLALSARTVYLTPGRASPTVQSAVRSGRRPHAVALVLAVEGSSQRAARAQ